MKNILAVVILFFLNAGIQAQTFYSTVGDTFPTFSTVDLDGNVFNNSNLSGEYALLVFFGTRCPPCIREIKELEKRKNFLKSKNIQVYIICSTDDKESVDKYLSKYRYDFNFIPDPNQYLYEMIGDHTIPRTLLLDKETNIIFQYLGYNSTPFARLMSLIENLD